MSSNLNDELLSSDATNSSSTAAEPVSEKDSGMVTHDLEGDSSSPYKRMSDEKDRSSTRLSSAWPNNSKLSRPVLEDWSDDEESVLLKTRENKQYVPYLNGIINEEYVGEHVQRQKYINKDKEAKQEIVPEEIIADRQRRIIELDGKSLKAARNKVSCLDAGIIEKSIANWGDQLQELAKRGEEVLTTLNCAGFLNAPQCYKDLQGECKLFLTRRKIPDTDKFYYRLWFYSYEEIPSTDASDMYTQHSLAKKHACWDTLWRALICHQEPRRKEFNMKINDTSRRLVNGAFISINLEDILAVHHQVNDITNMSRFIKNIPEPYEEKKVWCCDCLAPVCCPPPKEDNLTWNWSLSARAQATNQLSYLITGNEFSSEKSEAVITNPLTRSTEKVKLQTQEEFQWTRFHTIHLTYADGVEYNTKHRGVIVISPGEDTKLAMDLICRISALVEDGLMKNRQEKREIIRRMELDPKDPLLATKAALNLGGNESYLQIVGNLLYDKTVKYCWDLAAGKAKDEASKTWQSMTN